MVTLAVGAGVGFQKATLPVVQCWVKNFSALKHSEKRDLLSMFAQTVRTSHTSQLVS